MFGMLVDCARYEENLIDFRCVEFKKFLMFFVAKKIIVFYFLRNI